MISKRLAIFVVCCVVSWFPSRAVSQTVVQLPTFSSFSYGGTVLVPDRGSAHLGSVNRSASSYRRRGLNRALSSSLARSGASMHATIIDNAEIDRQILGGTPTEFLSQAGSRRERALKREPALGRTEEGKSLVRLARREYRNGNQRRAFEAYRMAVATLDGKLRDLAAAEFRRYFDSAADHSLRMARIRRSP